MAAFPGVGPGLCRPWGWRTGTPGGCQAELRAFTLSCSLALGICDPELPPGVGCSALPPLKGPFSPLRSEPPEGERAELLGPLQMKLPSSVGQKKIKALEQMLLELGVGECGAGPHGRCPP